MKGCDVKATPLARQYSVIRPLSVGLSFLFKMKSFYFTVLLICCWEGLFSVGAVEQINFDISILSAAAISKYNVPNKDKKGCTMTGFHSANYLAVKIKVSNTGQINYEIPSDNRLW